MDLVHSARVAAAAKEHERHSIQELLHEEERWMCCNSAYHNQKGLIANKALHAKDFTNAHNNDRATRGC